MSLLQKNAVLKKYRREYREQDATRSSSKEEGQTEEGGDDDTAVYPNVNAFQALGSDAGGALASPSSSPRFMRCVETTQMPAIGAPSVKVWSSGVSSGFRGTTAASVSMHSKATATATAGPSTVSTIRSPFPHQDGGGEANHAAPTRSLSPRNHTVNAGAGAEDKYFDLDNFIAPLGPLPLPPLSADGAPPALAPLGRRGADSTGPRCWSSRSDLSGEEDRAIADTHFQSPPTDPCVSPTTGTIGGEAFMSITDVPEASRSNHVTRATATSGLAPSAGESFGLASSVGGLSSFALAAGKPKTPTGGGAHVRSSPQVSTAVQRPIEVLTRVHKGPSGEEVSSSSSSPSSSFTVTEQEDDCGDVDGKPTTLREEAVRQLDLACANATHESHPAKECKNSSASAAMRLDISDTLLQPPTSILSEPSTVTVQTKDKSAVSHRSCGGAAANGSVESRRVAYAADGADASEEGAFSPVSGMDDNERASYAGMADDRNIPYADNRGVVFMQQVLSFSGTAHSLARIWDDEDVDVDPLTTDSMRLPPRALPPITFYEAYLELTKALRSGDAIAARQAEERMTDRACSSTVLQQAAPPVMALPTLKKAARAAILSCCGGTASRASTVAKQPQLSTAACNGPKRDELSGVAPAGETASARGGPEEHLRVIRALKSQPLSLQLTTHRRMLLTIFNTLTGKIPWLSRNVTSSEFTPVTSSQPSSSTAVKWESIGFQGSNPATDVRATGVLGVLQLLYLIDYYPAFAQRLWQLCCDPANEGASHSPSRNYRGGEPPVAARRARVSNELPFVLVCFNFTALVLDAAGQHILDEEVQKTANGKRPSFTSHKAAAKTTRPAAHPSLYAGMHVCCECYVGALALFVEAWRARPKAGAALGGNVKLTVPANRPSIADFGDIKARLRGKLLRKGAAKIMREAAFQVRGPVEQQE
ncbi:conserved hypothetical protein [Leishmania major strain Friedlin]|uniref:ELMO domain-containing protein n=1 Tax=Leishmania major TaxID=5664 RepID=Q4Q1S2_LEIMA|nr:conserved hypothetical protein [Leishmania major strain Friedlin]CAG9583674.1 engulfment_and_cell_motility_domain_2_-_putative [Leishmania major strain Friedlin]CAJ09107.1 conserved hypothetical protein [Leishmania major strain Friedlin]|eukprot:XP_001686726.1 conserved hypothetical protein [Leishmania major strain Friedlin]